MVAAAAARRKKCEEKSQSSVLPELDQHSEAASHEAVRSKTQRRLAPSQTALLRYQGLAAISVVQGNSRGNFLQISDMCYGARLHALIMRLIILTGY